jgi:hypothetical protein
MTAAIAAASANTVTDSDNVTKVTSPFTVALYSTLVDDEHGSLFTATPPHPLPRIRPNTVRVMATAFWY